MKTNAILKSFSCNQLLASDLSCLFFLGEALCPPSALHRLRSTWPGCIPYPLGAGIRLGIGCLEPLTLNPGKKSRNDLRGVSGDNVYRIGGLRRSESWDQDLDGNEVNRSFRYTANTVLMYVLVVCYSAVRCLGSISDNVCSLLNSRDQ